MFYLTSQEKFLFKGLLHLRPPWGFSRRNIRRKKKRWTDNQHLAIWRHLSCAQRMVRELFSDLSPSAKTRQLSVYKTQSRVVTDVLTEHDILKRHLYIMGWLTVPYEVGVEQTKKAPHPHSMRAWSFGSTETFISGLPFLGIRGHKEFKFGGHLKL